MYDFIAVDIDDVIRNLMGKAVELHNVNFPSRPIKHSDIISWSLAAVSPIGGLIYDFLFQANVEELYLESECMPYVHEGLNYLKNASKAVVLVSNQPTQQRKDLTLTWVSKQGLNVDGVIFKENKEELDFDLIIDDKQQTLDKAGPDRGIRFLRPWNERCEWSGLSMRSWADIANIIKE